MVDLVLNKKQYLDLNDQHDAYLFGFLWADAHIDKYHQKVSTSLKDLEITQLLYERFAGRMYTRKRIQKETGTVKTVNEWYSHKSLLGKNLLNLGFRKNINSIPVNSLYSFLLGFLDGDGNIYFDGRNPFQVTFASDINQDWSWFEEACNLIGFKNKFKIKRGQIYSKALNKKTSYSHTRITSSNALNFLELLYTHHNGISLPRKYEKYYSFIKYKQLQNYVKAS